MKYLLPLLLLCGLTACGHESQADTGTDAALATIGQMDPTAALMVSSAVNEANRVRAQYRLPPLVLDAQITRAAQGHATDMRQHNYFEHQSQDGRSPFDRMHDAGVKFMAAAENIALGQKTAALAFQAWLNSPGHRKNLLNPRYHRQGIGWSNGYWVHDFAD